MWEGRPYLRPWLALLPLYMHAVRGQHQLFSLSRLSLLIEGMPAIVAERASSAMLRHAGEACHHHAAGRLHGRGAQVYQVHLST